MRPELGVTTRLAKLPGDQEAAAQKLQRPAAFRYTQTTDACQMCREGGPRLQAAGARM